MDNLKHVKSLATIFSGGDNRLDWNSYFMSIAFLIASRSCCERLHVGCVLVKDTRVISVGYNGFLPKAPHKSMVVNNHEQATVHAEQNAITDCAKRGVSCEDAQAYITHYPCINCFKVLAASGINKIYYYDDYKNDHCVKELASGAGVEIINLCSN
jgi:dCMP deaminase